MDVQRSRSVPNIVWGGGLGAACMALDTALSYHLVTEQLDRKLATELQSSARHGGVALQRWAAAHTLAARAWAASPKLLAVFDVLAAISGATRAAPTPSSRPEEVDALVIDGPSGRRAVVVNLTDSPAQARLIGDADATVTLEPHDVVTINLPRRNP